MVVTVAGADELVGPGLIGAGPKGRGGRRIGREGHHRSSLLSLPAQKFPCPASPRARGGRCLVDSVALGKKRLDWFWAHGSRLDVGCVASRHSVPGERQGTGSQSLKGTPAHRPGQVCRATPAHRSGQVGVALLCR
jgi:hypothetical protein